MRAGASSHFLGRGSHRGDGEGQSQGVLKGAEGKAKRGRGGGV